jgi:serine/threonine-protein kinase HipA
MIERRSLDAFIGGRRVGTLALTPDRLCAFQYDREWLETGYSISPFHLPLTSELFIAKPTLFDGGFGVFDDSLPDGWGRLIFDRYLLSKGEEPERLSVLQLLAFTGDGGRGALEYRPSCHEAQYHSELSDESFSLQGFEAMAEDFFRSEPVNPVYADIDTFFKYSGASGGARPHVFLKTGGKEWLVKFRGHSDADDIGKIEYQHSLLAKQCGIRMPETCLFENKYFGTQRFDRTPDGKVHIISAAALLNADYRAPSLDYISLLNACRVLTGDMSETEALFRLMTFNVVIKNRDDHAKNFSFLYDKERWRVAPAYDILPSYGFGGYHTTTVNGSGNPTKEDVLAVAKAVGIGEKRAKKIFSEIAECCKK